MLLKIIMIILIAYTVQMLVTQIEIGAYGSSGILVLFGASLTTLYGKIK